MRGANGQKGGYCTFTVGNRNEAEHAVVIIPLQKQIEDTLSLMETCKNNKDEPQLIRTVNGQLFETLHL